LNYIPPSLLAGAALEVLFSILRVFERLSSPLNCSLEEVLDGQNLIPTRRGALDQGGARQGCSFEHTALLSILLGSDLNRIFLFGITRQPEPVNI